MRQDMFEVIIERPRHGGGRSRKGRRGEQSARAMERAPSQLGMGRGRGTKSLNENLAPLLRFLRNRAGKPWSRVRSELCESLSPASAVQMHVMEHVRGLVVENPVMIDGVPHFPAATGSLRDRYRPLRSHPLWPQFYVCPRTALLREARAARPRSGG